jgi:membrane protein implicated in regulation of membrane protease activity
MESTLSIGFGIFLMAVGAIVAWALPGLWQVEGANWTLIGYILLGAGALVTLFGIVMAARSGRSSQVSRSRVDPDSGMRVERTERRDDVL